MLNQAYDVQDILSYSLSRRVSSLNSCQLWMLIVIDHAIFFLLFFDFIVIFFKYFSFSLVQPNNDEDMQENGRLFVSKMHFERNTIASLHGDVSTESHMDGEVGFWVGLHPDDAMKSIRSLLPLSVVPKSFDNEFFAIEAIMKNGKKHAIFRGLVTVVNDSEFRLGISVCHISLVNDKNESVRTSSGNVIVEEIFENQYLQPNSGWGDKRPGSYNNGPGRWCTNFSYSSDVSLFMK